MKLPLAVTVSGRPSAPLEAEARSDAAKWGLPFLPRRWKQSLQSLLAEADSLLVFSREGLTLTDGVGTLGFHEGMAHLRLERLGAGEGDTLIRVAAVSAGEVIVDCTLGLGHDALVLSRAAGPEGRVIGLEKSLPLYALVAHGLAKRERASIEASAEASTGASIAGGADRPTHASRTASIDAPIEVIHADAGAWLRARPSRSADVVFFDPMFSKPRKSQGGFDMLRKYADHAPLAVETLAEARRVARRCVVVKGAAGSSDLSALGLSRAPTSRHADIVFAVLEAAP